MLHYANMSFILYSILKLLTYHTSFYHSPSLSYQRSNRSGFFGPPCIYLACPYYIVMQTVRVLQIDVVTWERVYHNVQSGLWF